MEVLLILGPAVVGVLALCGAVALATWAERHRRIDRVHVGVWVLVAVLALVAFGIGACYVWAFTGLGNTLK